MTGVPRRRIGLVIPWFGRDLRGGAELSAWHAATNLAARGHDVTVLTTCCRSFQENWSENHLAAGRETQSEGFTIFRFPVVQRNAEAFDRANAALLGTAPSDRIPGHSIVSKSEEDVFCDELIRSPALIEYLTQSQDEYEAFIFIPYLYSPIIQGLPVVAKKALLQPCLHDEPYAYLHRIGTLFRSARALLFNSEGEQELAAQLFGPAVLPRSRCIGLGIETPLNLDALNLPDSMRERLGNFVVFIGRKSAEKGVTLLVQTMRRYRSANPTARLNLVLAGGGADFSPEPGIIDLGRIDDETKWQLLRGALAGVSPGTNESYSRTMYEAWACGVPVLVHGKCPATAVAVSHARAGWVANDEASFCQAMYDIEHATAEHRAELGERGRTYTLEFGSWKRSTDRYEAAIEECCRPAIVSTRKRAPAAIHQLLPNLNYGDAISNEALHIRDQLREWGYESHVYARYIDPRVTNHCVPFVKGSLPRDVGLLYHHSIGSEVTPSAIQHSGPKALIYHNITPPRFYEPFRPEFAAILAQGLRDLDTLASAFPVSAGDSAFNAAELAHHGFHDPLVLPLAIEPKQWSEPPDAAVIRKMRDRPLNVLFVGRIAPNKKQDDLIVAFKHLLRFCPEAHLTLIGSADSADAYLVHIKEMIRVHSLTEHVTLAGHINDAAMQAYFRTAHLYWSMSEHEGFCVPIIEAMWFDVPVLAFKCTAVPETLGQGGLLFTDKSNPEELAAAAWLLATDPELRERVIEAQRSRRAHYLTSSVAPRLERLLSRLSVE